MASLPDFHQQPTEPPTRPVLAQEDLVVPEQVPAPQQPSPSTAPQQQQRVPTSTMVTVSPSYTSSHAFGVSFSGTANFAPLPFPPSEHPLPPPAHPAPPAIGPAHHPLPPPPPYVERSPQPPPPQARPAEPQPHPSHAAQPFVLFTPLPVPMPWSTSPYAYGAPAMLPSMATAPMLTPWPPVPLRRVDDFLGGTYTPGTSYGSYSPFVPSAPMHRENPSPPVPAAPSSASTSTPLQYPISSARTVQPLQHVERASPPPIATTFTPVAPASVAAAPYVAQHAQPHSPSPPLKQPLTFPPSPVLEHAPPLAHELCAVAGCTAHVFCELAPCGCRLCRDHLGWVIRGARVVDVEGDKGDEDDKPKKTKKVFRCVACRAESSMAGPATPPRSKSRDADSGTMVGLGLTGIDLPTADEVHAFSIKYFSSGPAPFAHRSPSPTSTATAGGHDVDLSTALDPVGDASLVQHLPVPTQPPAIELQPASPLAPLALAAAQAQALLPALDADLAHRTSGSMQPVPRPPSPPFPLDARFSADLPHAVAGFLFQPEAAHASPGELTPTDTVRASSSSDDGGAPQRPSSAQPALEGATALSPPGPALGTRALSRSATSPPAMYVPDPLDVPRAPSPIESTSAGTPSPVGGVPTFPQMYAPEPSYISHRRASQAHAYAHPYALQPHPYGPAAAPPLGRFARSYSQPPAFAPLALHAAPYTPFPPGSVSVTPHFAHAAHFAHALAPGPRMGKKRASLPSGVGTGGSTGFARWVERAGPPGGTADGAGGLPASASFPPRMPPPLEEAADGSKLERGKWPIVKVENIPFHTTVQDVEKWLPAGYLPHESECIQPIHIVLHRATGRTLPHCYLETADVALATELITRLDRSQLGDRTVRVKWERAGELMRDLFAQDAYFQMGATGPGQHVSSPAAAPLPHLPPEGFRLPDVLLSAVDLNRLVQYSVRAVQYRERPFERAFFNAATLLNKFPWARDDLWDEDLRDMMFETTHQMLLRALGIAKQDALFVRIAHLLVKSGKACPAFTAEQKDALAAALSNAINAHPSPANSPKKTRSSPLPPAFAPAPILGVVPSLAPQTPPQAAHAQLLPMTPESPASPLLRAVPPHFAVAGARGRSRGWRAAANFDGHGDRREWVAVPRGSVGEEGEGVRKGWAEGSSDEEVANIQRTAAHLRHQGLPVAAQAVAEQIERPLSASAFPPLPAKPTAAIAALDTPPASPETFRRGRRV
ncbi:hypothetical protein JCM10450v2_006995 [Rhodotorula kratochvilovae]